MSIPLNALILICEEIEHDRDLIISRLSQLGFSNLLHSQSFLESQKLIEQQALKNKPVDLILSNLLESSDEGLSFIAWLKSHNEFHSVPFLFVSSLSQSEKMMKGIQFGATALLTKPFSEITLLHKMTTAWRSK